MFRWKADATQPQGGSWEDATHNSMERSHLDGLLYRVHASHGGAVQAATAVAAAAAGVGAAAAGVSAAAAAERPRPAPEEKRYTLIVVLGYALAPTVRAGKAVSARFKWENEMTGPESHRSCEIKPSDPMFRELSCRKLRAGDYTLAFQKSPRAVRSLELKK